MTVWRSHTITTVGRELDMNDVFTIITILYTNVCIFLFYCSILYLFILCGEATLSRPKVVLMNKTN